MTSRIKLHRARLNRNVEQLRDAGAGYANATLQEGLPL
jgi:hypothetical protein